MSTIDSILNFVIPPAVAIFVVFILLYPFRVPLAKGWEALKNWRENREPSETEINVSTAINYE